MDIVYIIVQSSNPVLKRHAWFVALFRPPGTDAWSFVRVIRRGHVPGSGRG